MPNLFPAACRGHRASKKAFCWHWQIPLVGCSLEAVKSVSNSIKRFCYSHYRIPGCLEMLLFPYSIFKPEAIKGSKEDLS